MTDFIKGKIKQEANSDLFSNQTLEGFETLRGLEFSEEAKAVFEAGHELWKYYHAQPVIARNETKPSYNANASLYDISEHFQGRNEQGRMNSKSDDATYSELIGNLRETLKTLAEKIQPKVYQYGFLKE